MSSLRISALLALAVIAGYSSAAPATNTPALPSKTGGDMTTLLEHRRACKLGRAYQNPRTGTAASMSIEENLSMALRRGQPRCLDPGVTEHLRTIFPEALPPPDLGLENRLDSSIGTLSLMNSCY